MSGDVVILRCAGRLVFGDETAAFRERVKNILLGTRQIVVNLNRIDYIDSGGLVFKSYETDDEAVMAFHPNC